MDWTIKRFDELTKDELYEILRLRSEVFVLEQHCSYQDVDGRDQRSYHMFASDKGKIAAYLRILEKGAAYPEVSIGRVLTAYEYRNRGLGKTMMQKAVDYIVNDMGETDIRISAQAYLRKFYENLGFKAVSGVYDDAGVDHIEMLYSI